MTDDFIDIHRLDRYFSNKVQAIQNDSQLSEANRKIILRYLRESELGKTLKKGQKRQIGAGRNIQAAGFLSLMANHWFNRTNLDSVSMQQMEDFIGKLNKDEIKSTIGTPYSSESKSNIKKFIRKFYKWLLGEGRFYPDIVDWIDTSKKEAEVEAVPKLDKGVWQIVELIPEIRRKALVWVSFDSGFRESELLNCRIGDIEKNDEGIYYITCRYSKTKPRTVSLPYSSQLLDQWLAMHPKKDDPSAQLWQTSKVMFYKTVRLYGYKAHKKNITVHMLRHTSATFYAPKLDRTTFCKRFGWSYSSGSPDRYIDFAKVAENKVIDVVRIEKISQISSELEEQKIRNLNLTVRIEEMQKKMEILDKFENFMKSKA